MILQDFYVWQSKLDEACCGMSLENEIRSQYLTVIDNAEIAIGARLPRFRSAEFSFRVHDRQGVQNPNFFLLPGLPSKAYWPLEDLPQAVQDELSTVTINFQRVRDEYITACSNMQFKRGITGYFGHSNEWRHHDLVVKGGMITDGIEHDHPTLYGFCRTLVREHYLAGSYFAVMSPACHLRSHCGAFNHALRLHLGLIVPPGDCALAVNGMTRSWQPGQWLCFDDTYWHEAWNRTTSDRHILLARILHPELSVNERRAFYVIEQNPLFWRVYTEFKNYYLHCERGN